MKWLILAVTLHSMLTALRPSILDIQYIEFFLRICFAMAFQKVLCLHIRFIHYFNLAALVSPLLDGRSPFLHFLSNINTLASFIDIILSGLPFYICNKHTLRRSLPLHCS